MGVLRMGVEFGQRYCNGAGDVKYGRGRTRSGPFDYPSSVIARSEATWQSRSRRCRCEERSGVAIPLILSLSKDANEIVTPVSSTGLR